MQIKTSGSDERSIIVVMKQLDVCASAWVFDSKGCFSIPREEAIRSLVTLHRPRLTGFKIKGRSYVRESNEWLVWIEHPSLPPIAHGGCIPREPLRQHAPPYDIMKYTAKRPAWWKFWLWGRKRSREWMEATCGYGRLRDPRVP